MRTLGLLRLVLYYFRWVDLIDLLIDDFVVSRLSKLNFKPITAQSISSGIQHKRNWKDIF